MMHSFKRLGRSATPSVCKYFLMGLVFAGCIWLVQDCAASSPADEFSKSFEAVLQQYSLEDEDVKLARLWDDYLKNVTGFDSNEYQTACRQLARQYHQALIDLGKCSQEISEKEKSHSSQWMDDLIKRFGKAYVSNNMDLINFHLSYLYTGNIVNSCVKLEKEAVYREYSCKAAFNTYFGLYLGFIESLDEEQKRDLNKRKAVVEGLMEIINKASIRDIIADGALRASLFDIAIKDRPNSDAMLTEFFSKHSFFSKPFNVMKCLDDLNKATKN